MNPSAPDWILKFFDLFNKNELVDSFPNELSFYESLRSTGFIYGTSMNLVPEHFQETLKLTKEELTKVNLFHALVFQYFRHYKDASNQNAVEAILEFYEQMEKGKVGFFKKLSFSTNPYSTLESTLSARIHEANTLFNKNTLSLLTYALLMLDVLAFKHWLTHPESAKKAYKQLEEGVLNYCFFTLKAKQKKTKYDKLLIDLFETSTQYVLDWDIDGSSKFFHKMEYLHHSGAIERQYILDLCCLTIWEDLKMDEGEQQYLAQIMTMLELDDAALSGSLMQLAQFASQHNEKLQLFEHTNPVKSFYKHSASTVKLLIIRNKSRLLLELEESGELVLLLGQSTVRDLSPAEKIKVKNQLLDVCKTIPSLTIFLLPGGSVLMPLLVKFIPQLLPSAFQSNRIDKEK